VTKPHEFDDARKLLVEEHAFWDAKIAATLPAFNKAKAEYERLNAELGTYLCMKDGLKRALAGCYEAQAGFNRWERGVVDVIDPENF
jgi:hypothetical protein